ncbi:MAG: hypothetical protein Kow00129_08980 [Thermoleophilia bacterium]
MSAGQTGDLSLMAEFFRYPSSEQRHRLEEKSRRLKDPKLREATDRFLQRIDELTTGDWEELYTGSFDLEPSASPYLGWQAWGDEYRRGQLLALLAPQLDAAEVDRDGELPDHLVPVLQYLDRAASPSETLLEIAPSAVRKMVQALRKRQTDNPYAPLLEAVAETLSEARQGEARQHETGPSKNEAHSTRSPEGGSGAPGNESQMPGSSGSR